MSYYDDDQWGRWPAEGGRWDDTTMRPPTLHEDQQWQAYGHHQPPRSRGCLIASLVIAAVLVLLAVVAVLAYVLLRDGDNQDAGGRTGQAGRATSTWTTGSPAPPDGGSTGNDGASDDTGAPSTGSPSQRGPSSASEASIPAGADRSGWLAISGARCNAGDPAYLIGATTTAAFSICQNPDNGRYYYRGAAEAGTIEIADPVLGSDSATVYNKGHVYEISSSRLVISNGGGVIFDEPMNSYWVR